MIAFLLRIDRALIFLVPVLLLFGFLLRVFAGVADPDFSALHNVGVEVNMPAWLNYLSCTLLAGIAALLVNQTAQGFGLLGRISNFGMLFFVLLFFALPAGTIAFYNWWLVFLHLSIFRIFLTILETPGRVRYHIFNAGVLIGILALQSPWSAMFLVLGFVSAQYNAALTLRIIFIALMGLLLPLYFLNAGLYLLEMPLHFPNISLPLQLIRPPFSAEDGLAFLLVITMMMIAAISALSSEGSSTLREKRKWLITLYMLAISSALVLNGGWREHTLLLLIPGAVIFARAFLNLKNAKLATFILLAVLAVIFFINSAQ